VFGSEWRSVDETLCARIPTEASGEAHGPNKNVPLDEAQDQTAREEGFTRP